MRLLVAVAGLVFGLVLFWAWVTFTPSLDRICDPSNDCPIYFAWPEPVGFLVMWGPVGAFAVVNAIAWNRWTLRQWASTSLLTIVATICVYTIVEIVDLIPIDNDRYHQPGIGTAP
ncbi:MAG: hypothetical protein KGI75_19375 [Rhizobiaceae bacterium]|nr:hypothetical protein [Rhizobiaceae bacterium]